MPEEPFALGASLAATFGLIYLQDRSSLLPPLALDPPKGAAVLDMCASPGGKTGYLAGLVGPEGFVLGNEPSHDRLNTLRRNLARLNLMHTATCSCPGENLPFDDATWSWILLDPPCSGWGTADKHPRVKQIWKDDKVGPLVGLQKKLLAEASRLLRPGGTVVYSTCTTNVEENEAQVVWARDELGLEVEPLAPVPGYVFDEPERGLSGVLRVNQVLSASQGFFIARLRKPGPAQADESESFDPPAPPQFPEPGTLPGQPLDLAELLSAVPGASMAGLPPGLAMNFKDRVFYLHARALELLPSSLRWQGFPLGKCKKDRFIPSARARLLLDAQELGAGDCFVEADEGVLKGLLCGQSLRLAGENKTGAGVVGVRWRGLGLGWLTVKGGRGLWGER